MQVVHVQYLLELDVILERVHDIWRSFDVMQAQLDEDERQMQHHKQRSLQRRQM